MNMIQHEKLDLFDLLPLGIIFFNRNGQIISMNHYASDHLQEKTKETKFIQDILPHINIGEKIERKKSLHFKVGNETFIAQRLPLYLHNDGDGEILVFQHASDVEEAIEELDLYKNLNLDLKAIFDISYDVIYVSDGDGNTLRVSSACEKLWGYKEKELVGKNVCDLEREGVYQPSVTRLVLEKKEKVSMIQTTKTGRRLKVVGIPIKDEEGRVIRVVNASRDITEISQLQSEIETLRQLMEGYRKEVMDLRPRRKLKKK
jgi:PAS domain S-box-containing protein